MNTKDQLSKRFNDLVSIGISVSQTQRSSSDGAAYVDTQLFQHWRTASLSAILQTFTDQHPYYQTFNFEVTRGYLREVDAGLGVLNAAKAEIDGGWLAKITTLIEADIFTDFLDMSDHLLNNHYFIPAASLIGAVLEDGLRRIASEHSILLDPNESISKLNDKLRKANIYNQMIWRQVSVWGDLRNYADHGHFNQFQESDVIELLREVRAFLSQYL